MTQHKPGTIRIIGGQWRRRLLKVPNVEGLRPTHDRIRETLFNWLMRDIEGARCLDLFAGSGALGFEALSRGADFVSFVDNNPTVIQQLRASAEELTAPKAGFEVVTGNVLSGSLPLSFDTYDIIFLDPPYHQNRLPELAEWLESNNYISKSGLIYVEMEKQRESFSYPGWRCLKEGQTSKISYYLFQRELSS